MRRRNRSESGGRNRIGAVLFGALAGMAVGILLADRGLLSLPKRRRATRDAAPDVDADDQAEPERIRPLRTARAPRRAPDDEAQLEARVLETFRNDPILVDRPIDIGAIGTGIIELTGWVDAPEEIRHATTLTRGTIGVHTVVNRLLVKGAPAA
jgi:BON domain